MSLSEERHFLVARNELQAPRIFTPRRAANQRITSGRIVASILALLTLWAPSTYAVELPSISVTILGQEGVQVDPPEQPETLALLENYSFEEMELFVEKRAALIRATAATLSRLDSAKTTAQWPIRYFLRPEKLTKEFRSKLVLTQTRAVDKLLCEHADLVIKADQYGIGISAGGFIGGGVASKVLGAAAGPFVSFDYSFKSKKRHFRMGVEYEVLEKAWPGMLSVGTGVRVFFYLTQAQVTCEHGRYHCPFIGPSFTTTNTTMAVSKWAGASLSVPPALLYTTRISRYHFRPSDIVQAVRGAVSTCAAKILGWGDQ